MNVVVLRGTIARDPFENELANGDQVVTFDVATEHGEGAAAEVPVAVYRPKAAVRRLAAGDEVAVTGHVRRRFFRAGGATQSRTEVVAHAVVRARQPAKARALMQAAADELCGAA